jgi:hypothetical protein
MMSAFFLPLLSSCSARSIGVLRLAPPSNTIIPSATEFVFMINSPQQQQIQFGPQRIIIFSWVLKLAAKDRHGAGLRAPISNLKFEI